VFKNIQQLPPGHSLVLENGHIRVWQYWHLEYPPEGETAEDNEKKLTEELLRLVAGCDLYPVAARMSLLVRTSVEA